MDIFILFFQLLFFFTQKTAYDMLISDWSSDVCSSDLLADGRAYWCDCTAEEVQARAKERGGPPGYDGHCRDRGVERGPTTALRFRSPDEGSTGFDDLIRGHVVVENKTLEDFVLLRSSGTPPFILAHIVADAGKIGRASGRDRVCPSVSTSLDDAYI